MRELRSPPRSAFEALKRARGSVFIEVARRALPGISPAGQEAIRAVLQARGEAL